MNDFEKLGVSPELAGQLVKQGIRQPTAVQKEAIPVGLSGRDVMAQAQTGTGKTLAFLLPLLMAVNAKQDFPQALILAPTRELALQVSREAERLATVLGIKALAIYGGQDVNRQQRQLAGPVQVIIGTTGRILDHCRKEQLTLRGVKTVVIDEADTMLSLGFLEEVAEIMTQTSPKRQTLLFSATLPEEVQELANQHLTSPVHIEIKAPTVTLPEIEQRLMRTTEEEKPALLAGLIQRQRPYLAIVFCLTRGRSQQVAEYLAAEGIECEELNGDLSPNKRQQVMKRFREAKFQVLVATDLAARGLDVEGVTHVYNYDIPHDGDTYIHRIGRTGRAGETGMAVTFMTDRDRHYLVAIEKRIKTTLTTNGEKAKSAVKKAPVRRVRKNAPKAGQALAFGKTPKKSGKHGGKNLRSRRKTQG